MRSLCRALISYSPVFNQSDVERRLNLKEDKIRAYVLVATMVSNNYRVLNELINQSAAWMGSYRFSCQEHDMVRAVLDPHRANL